MNNNNLNIGDSVMVPRIGGGYSLGTIVAIRGDRAICEFPLGKTYQGKPNNFAPEDIPATKNVALANLKPVDKD